MMTFGDSFKMQNIDTHWKYLLLILGFTHEP